MLPSARHSLERGGFSESTASWMLIGLFLGGAVGIQAVSSIMHHFLPSHVVDCDHTHDDDTTAEELIDCPDDEESQPLRGGSISHGKVHTHGRPSLTRSRTSIDKFGSISSWDWPFQSKPACESGDCHGFTKPCGNCFKNVQAQQEIVEHPKPTISRSLTETPTTTLSETTPLLSTISEESGSSTLTSDHNDPTPNNDPRPHSLHTHPSHDHEHPEHPERHHHHVPTNKFLSIGLQTSIAIALHKLPEGFITYATNHANPRLGISVFLSLFIHNFTEGFALALPLYLALHSRVKSMIWSALLGGVSQPLGAGIAALWFHIAGNSNMAPGEAVYGGMFAVVAGIMTYVALQLMGESLELTHSRNLCFLFAFLGMSILGVSSALTAES
jgi:ZIP family zinc transporter